MNQLLRHDRWLANCLFWPLCLFWLLAASMADPSAAAAQDQVTSRTSEQWRELLSDSKYEVLRRRAAYALGRADEAFEQNAAALAAALQDRDLVVRWYAADSLGRLQDAGRGQIPKMLDSLASSANDRAVRLNLVRSLRRLAPVGDEAAEALEELLGGDESLVAIAAAEALIRNGDEKPYEKLLAHSASDQPEVAFEALQAIGRLDDLRSPPLEMLAERLNHASSDVRRSAAELLARQDGQAAALLLDKLQDDVQPALCLAALRFYLGNRGENTLPDPQQRAIANAAWRRIADREASTRDAAIHLLVGGERASIDALLDVWPTQTDDAWRREALRILGDWMRKQTTEETNRVSWSDERRMTLRRQLVSLLEKAGSDDPTSRKLALWLLAELPLYQAAWRPTDSQRGLLQSALRDADIFNRRNAARLLSTLRSGPADAFSGNIGDDRSASADGPRLLTSPPDRLSSPTSDSSVPSDSSR